MKGGVLVFILLVFDMLGGKPGERARHRKSGFEWWYQKINSTYGSNSKW